MVEFAVAIDVAPDLDEPVDVANIERAVMVALRIAGDEDRLPAHPSLAVSVRVTDDQEIQSLNQMYRGVDTPTDVLSFSFVEENAGPVLRIPDDVSIELGEIVISLPHAACQAQQLAHALDVELAWLSIHGTLQLVGYHHADEQEALHMEDLEKRALQQLGFNPD